MYEYGIMNFMAVKGLKPKKTITAFLKDCGVDAFDYKNRRRVNEYIQANWTKFASYCDRKIRSGELQGKAVCFRQDEKDRHEIVRKEFEETILSDAERLILDEIKRDGPSKIHSFISKKGHQIPKKDFHFESRYLRFLPTAQLASELGYTNQ